MFIEPPAYEKDQTSTHRSVRELRGFLDTFPMSKFARQAKEMLAEASRMLMAHDLYVADFYEARDKPRAVAWRLEHIINTYPETAKTPQNVWRMAKSYEAASDFSDAKRAFALYLAAFPNMKSASEVEQRIDEMQKKLEEAQLKEAQEESAKQKATPAPQTPSP
jgi:outer membrane protein assembly factor BamD